MTKFSNKMFAWKRIGRRSARMDELDDAELKCTGVHLLIILFGNRQVFLHQSFQSSLFRQYIV